MNLKNFTIALLILLLTGAVFADPIDPEITLYERDPWLKVKGADSPMFAAYKSGVVIWWHGTSPRSGDYRSVTLTPGEYSQLAAKLKGALSIKNDTTAAEPIGRPEVELRLALPKLDKSVTFDGSLSDAQDRKRAPKELVKIYDYLTKFKHPKSTPWHPDFIEVLVLPYESATEKSIIWPKEWPDLTSPTTRQSGKFYSVYVPFAHHDALMKFIGTKVERGAIEINGKKWVVATRIPFPHENPVQAKPAP